MKEQGFVTRRKTLTGHGCVLAVVLSIAGPAFAQDPGWPREIETDEATIVMYQPQVESFHGNDLSGRAAVSVTPSGESGPVFGAVWLDARVETDRDERLVEILDVQVTRVRFADATPAQEGRLASILEEAIPAWNLQVSLDRLITSLESAERERLAADELGFDPPAIVFRSQPAVLVTIDGQPQLHRDDSGVMRVINTPFLIVLSGNDYFLYAGTDAWYTASAVTGPYEYVSRVPAEVARLAPEESDLELPEAEEAANAGAIPEIVVVTEPTELLYTDGEPAYTPLSTGNLMYVSNTDSDLFLDIETQLHYVVLSGRWYTSASLEGPWTYVAADSLPASFAEIPAESEVGSVRVHVAGTDEANEAALDAQVPQTAAIRRDATIDVEYDGEPQFEPIEGTEMAYAVNSPYSVLRIDGRYWACHEAVWYEADAPTGPWRVATDRPDGVDEIPPQNPHYNVKYVYVYDVTPEVIYVGYTPGYTGTYVYQTVVVYGTGYYYPGWYSVTYYPRPATWGFHVRYNPWTGWSYGVVYSNGRFTFGIGIGAWSPWYRGWWGPAGYHGYWRGHRRGYYHGWHRGYYQGRRAGYRAGYREGARTGYRRSNIYTTQNPGKVASRGSGDPGPGGAARPATRGAAPAARDRAPTGRVSRTQANNVFADRDGNVLRRSSQGTFERPGGAGGTTVRPSSTRELEREHQARQRGTQKTNNFQRTKSTGGRRGGDGSVPASSSTPHTTTSGRISEDSPRGR